MSKARAIAAINGQPADRIPQWDSPDNPSLAKMLFNYDVWKNPEKTAVDCWKHFDIDLTHFIPGDIAEWNFPLVRYYGEAVYTDDPRCAPYKRAYKQPLKKPYQSMYDQLERTSNASFWGLAPTLSQNYNFTSPEDVLSFDPLSHDPYTLEERTSFFQKHYREKQALLGDSCLMTGWYYHTLFMWPVEIFGWEHFMVASMLDPARFSEILDQFFKITWRDISAMCKVESLPLLACHDDLCSANGPMFAPSWYENHIFPYYKKLFAMIHAAGKKVIFVCDGNVVPLLDQILATGVDGIVVDGQSDLAIVAEKFSGRIIAGGMKPAVVSQGTLKEIESMVQKTVSIIRGEPGYFFKCSGMNGETSAGNVFHYQECLRRFGSL